MVWGLCSDIKWLTCTRSAIGITEKTMARNMSLCCTRFCTYDADNSIAKVLFISSYSDYCRSLLLEMQVCVYILFK